MQLRMFADDTVLLPQTEEDLQQNVKKFSEAVKRHKLVIKTEKTTTIDKCEETDIFGCGFELEWESGM